MFVDMAAYQDCNAKFGEQTKRQLESGGPTKGCVSENSNLSWINPISSNFQTSQCIGECVMNATSLYSNGMIEKDGFKKYVMKNVMGDSKWETLFSNMVDKCADMAAALSKEFADAAALPPSFDGEMVCHPISGYMMKCLSQELFKSCPDKMSKFEGYYSFSLALCHFR
jgi:hypothetical protein